MANRQAPGATASLVLGILSIVLCPILAIFGLIQANGALRACDENADLEGRGSAQAGKVLSIIGLVFLFLWLLWLFALGGLALVGFTQGR